VIRCRRRNHVHLPFAHKLRKRHSYLE
jgi:hypothetical protein